MVVCMISIDDNDDDDGDDDDSERSYLEMLRKQGKKDFYCAILIQNSHRVLNLIESLDLTHNELSEAEGSDEDIEKGY